MMGILETCEDDLIFESVNPAVAQFMNLPVGNSAAGTFSQLAVPADKIQLWIKGCRRSEEQRQAHRFESNFEKNGKTLWFAGAVSFLGKNAFGRSRISFTLLDVTERKCHERDLEFINDVTAALTSYAWTSEARSKHSRFGRFRA